MPVGSITTKLSSFSIFCKKGKYFSVDFAPVRPALGLAGFGVKAPEVKTPAELDVQPWIRLSTTRRLTSWMSSPNRKSLISPRLQLAEGSRKSFRPLSSVQFGGSGLPFPGVLEVTLPKKQPQIVFHRLA